MFISGESIQELCTVYCGLQADFEYNPRIRMQPHKHKHIDLLREPWDNPPIIFCYSHRVELFMQRIDLLQNDFTLVSHNEDTNITEKYKDLLDNPKLQFWHAQNVMYDHLKLGGIPIGIANRMWPHGNQYILREVIQKNIEKKNSVYFNFSIWTNAKERGICFKSLENKLPWHETQEFTPYLESLASYKYAICPPGNGIDCHRMWECFYLQVIPVVLRSVFTEKLSKVFPCYLLDTWDDFDMEKLLSSYVKPSYSISFDQIRECIRENKKFI
jgi:hypothetical protein